jgi:hypothetical protein
LGDENELATLTYVGYILALIGGILIVVFSLLALISAPFLIFSPLVAIGSLGSGIIGLIIGVVIIIGAKYIGTLVWAIVLLILGLIVAEPGSILVVLGAILGLISALTHEHRV